MSGQITKLICRSCETEFDGPSWMLLCDTCHSRAAADWRADAAELMTAYPAE